MVYVHGGGIDQPLAIVRYDYNDSVPGPVMLLPHSNSLGAIDTATYAPHCYVNKIILDKDLDDTTTTVHQPPAQPRCLQVPYPARYRLSSHESTSKDVSGPVSWMGSLITSNRDASGLMFRRNRYYDPQGGRFTQEDPIGLAGGVNVYGFAAGDPVNYDDPYGLSPNDCKKVECPKTPREVSENKQIQRFAQELMMASMMDSQGAEYGGHIVRQKNGGLALTDVRRGLVGTIVGFPDAPENAIAEIHTHPDEPLVGGGKLTFEFPSGNDAQRANDFHVYGIIVTPRNFHIIPVDRDTYQSFLRTQTMMPPAQCPSRVSKTPCPTAY